MADPLILVVDPDAVEAAKIKLDLEKEELQVIAAFDTESAVEAFETRRPDLMITEISLPSGSGLELMRKIRERSNTPIVILTDKTETSSVIRGLELGADDYIAKSVDHYELALKIKAVLRRSLGPSVVRIVKIGDLEIDLSKRRVRSKGEVLNLTRTEWILLEILARKAGEPVSQRELLSKVWGPEFINDTRYIVEWISRLRRKLGDDPKEQKYIQTLAGFGYRLNT